MASGCRMQCCYPPKLIFYPCSLEFLGFFMPCSPPLVVKHMLGANKGMLSIEFYLQPISYGGQILWH